MKRFAEMHPGKAAPSRGYLAECSRCGLLVVHSERHRRPFHMHYRSAKCRREAERRGRERTAVE